MFPGLSRLSPLTTSSATATPTTLVAALASFTVGFALAVFVVEGEVGDCQALGEVDLGADRVGEVADHEDVLDVVVEVVLYLGGIDLGREGQRAHEELSEGVVGLDFLVQNAVDPFADAVQQAEGLLDRVAEGLDIRDKRSGSGLVVLCAGNGVEGASVCIAV